LETLVPTPCGFFLISRDPKAKDSPRIAGVLAEFQKSGTVLGLQDNPWTLELNRRPKFPTLGVYFYLKYQKKDPT